MAAITRDNCHELLAQFIEDNSLSVSEIAQAIGCSEATIRRILERLSLPSDEMLKQVAAMVAISFPRYTTLSQAEKAHISDAIGAIGGGVLGFGTLGTVISSLGTVSGLSAAGITSGLAAMGAAIGGGMVAGVAIAAAIPLTAGVVGYRMMLRTAKEWVAEWEQERTDFDEKWEISLNDSQLSDVLGSI